MSLEHVDTLNSLTDAACLPFVARFTFTVVVGFAIIAGTAILTRLRTAFINVYKYNTEYLSSICIIISGKYT